ncbi:MAG: ATP-binding protein [Flavobacteriales bacterium]|nr:ATP-binding protein [Flavobacteriales bacterium]
MKFKSIAIGVLLIVLSVLLRNYQLEKSYVINQGSLESELIQDLNQINQSIDVYEGALSEGYGLNSFDALKSLIEEEDYQYYIYENDTLKYWSESSTRIDHILNSTSFYGHLIRLKTGWFLFDKGTSGAFTIVGLKCIKRLYPYENEYLKNEFKTLTSIDPNCKITVHDPKNDALYINVGGVTGFYLDFSNVDQDVSVMLTLALVLGLFGIVLILYGLQRLIMNRGLWPLVFYINALFIIRLITLYFSWPADAFDIPLFDPTLYAGSFFSPSLGDFTINIVLLLYISYLFNRKVDFQPFQIKSRPLWVQLLSAVMMINLLFHFGHALEELIGNLIKNSSISFNINNLFELNIYSGIGIICIGLLLITYFLIIDKFVLLLTRIILKRNRRYPILLLSLCINIPLHVLAYKYDLAFFIWTISIICICFIIYAEKRQYTFTITLILIAFSTIFSAEELLKHNQRKELKTRDAIAEKLIHDDDPIAELLIGDMLNKLVAEPILNQDEISLEDFDLTEFKKILNQKYLSGYFSKYNTECYLYLQNGESVQANSGDSKKNSRSYFDGIFDRSLPVEPLGNLVYIDDAALSETYLLKFLLKDDVMNLTRGTVYISFISKLLPEEIGFPELLLDDKANKTLVLDNYSFAKYRNGKLTKEYGEFKYNVTLQKFLDRNTEREGFNHLIKTDDIKTVVISKPMNTFLGKITTFSYLFALYSVILIVVILINNATNLKFRSANFQNRTQFLLVNILFFTLILFGIGTGYYINKQYQQKNYNAIQEKIKSVLTEIEHKLGGSEDLNSVNPDYLQYILNKFSNVFFTDINLFNLSGDLLASSQPKLFQEGIVDHKMHPEAFDFVHNQDKSFYAHQEKIGNLNYLSAYVPFQNKEGLTLAYLNLPYFAKQKDLEQEISSFLVALINIYVFLFALSIVTALLISNLLTKPMRMIESMLGKIELTKTNQKIEYNRNDELGKLVAVYNQKVNELAESAEKLAKSERESAWREMARQVAHEIKNPLTPMKLSVQHLQRSWEADIDNWDERLERFTKTMIEQIDTLSHIASEFSNFAKMPKARNEDFDLLKALESCVALYEKSADIHWERNDKDFVVHADKEQILRVFNNVIKNAIQAIPNDRKGRIVIRTSEKKFNYEVSIEDNGIGIHPDQKEKIFQPNFTTKTGGMGLGLAMSKKIIETAKGDIWFESDSKGTTFYIHLPKKEI